jgi:hypothetical protein
MSSTLAGRKQAIWLDYENTVHSHIDGDETVVEEIRELELMFPDIVGYMKPYRF